MYGAQTTFTYYPLNPNLPPPPPPPQIHDPNNYNPFIQSQPVPVPIPVPDPIANFGPYPVTSYPNHDPYSYSYPGPNPTFAATQPNSTVASVSYGPSVNNNLFSKIPRVFKKKQKKPKKLTNNGSVTQTQPAFCTICKIECSSVLHYEKHVSGKKHNKTLKKMYLSMMSSVQPETAALDGQGSSVSADLAAKKQKLLECGTAPQCLRMCNICNVACNGEIVYSSHIDGKKHISQERALSNRTNTTTIPVSNPGTTTQNTAEKTPVIVQAYCEVCKISCTSSENLVIHRQGKRHKKNLESLRNSISTTTPSSSSSIPVGPMSVSTAVVTVSESEQLKEKVARSVEPMDLETKKRRIMENGGVDEGNVRICAICNVVCNSERVFSTHLAGQKHASLMRRAEATQPGL